MIPARIRTATVLLTALTANLPAAAAQTVALSRVTANDNRQPAGTATGAGLTINLMAGRGEWRPEGDEGPALEIAAFGEHAQRLQTPGPLLRAAEGTQLIVRITNTLSDVLEVHGLVTRPAAADATISVNPGETREVRFAAGVPGTYYYWATTGRSTLATRKAGESQLGGAFIVDARDDVPSDRVLVLTQWDDSRVPDDEIVLPENRRVFAMNGSSWPYTERLEERVGEQTRWRLVNLTRSGHPMHLHGFYYFVQATGTGLSATAYKPDAYRQVVTELMPIGGTMDMAWTPERTGNWLLHCHLVAHVTPALRFWLPANDGHGEHAAHGTHHGLSGMAGLVMGIRVIDSAASAATTAAPARAARQITLAMRRRAGYWRSEDAYGFALDSGTGDANRREAQIPGPLLVLHRGEPVEITLKNELPEPTAIHWHGIELESYFDGVPGWSGSSQAQGSTTPMIEPGGSFRVQFTPPRVGTFMYHTHSDDLRQLASGLYGAIVVLEPGEQFDPLRDHVVLLGMEGTKDTQKYDRFPVLVNGTRDSTMTFKAGVPNRVRLINITTNFGGLNVSLISANEPLPWRFVAKDGADLPLSQQSARPALRQRVTVGETYDFVVEPPRTGPMWIEVRRGNGEWVQQVRVVVEP